MCVATSPCPRVSTCTSRFQSLAGFLVRCDGDDLLYVPGDLGIVSIPGGFSCALRRRRPGSSSSKTCWFQSLAGFLVRCDGEMPTPRALYALFQSLAGFIVRCDVGLQPHSRTHSHSFNPWRVFLCVATDQGEEFVVHAGPFQSLAGFLVRCDGKMSPCQGFVSLVSIPGGFSCALRLPNQFLLIRRRSRFNPWRVFLCVATLRS